MEDKFKNLKRPRHPMSDYIKLALLQHNVMTQFNARPAYQQNDYISWINRAVRQATKDKRLKQMIEELKDGYLYMKMKYSPPH